MPDLGRTELHPTLLRAAEGELPDWAEVGAPRHAHILRVLRLMADWAEALNLGAEERTRWMAAATLHDALRDASPESLRPNVPPGLRDLEGSALHGPAAAERLRAGGVDDPGLLRAIAYHTIGHPEWDELGCALYVADYLEPGRPFRQEERAAWAKRFPSDPHGVLIEVLRTRISRCLERGWPLRAETVGLWNSRVRGGKP
jgi:HD superfamily phosphohydrolase YqeK